MNHRPPFPYLCTLALAILIAWVPGAMANQNFGDCVGCHGVFGSGPSDPEHSAHAALAGGTCSVCHATSTNNPPLSDCTQCHGRPGEGGAGLRQHHRTVGVATCSGCHANPENTAPEDTQPSFYPGPAGLNSCDGSEEAFASNSVSLDNDGDGLTDGADPDCAPPPAEICDSGVDEDGDGLIDCADPDCDGFVGAATTCGVGECAATGNLVCTTPDQVDTCTPGTPGAEGPFDDVSCTDGLDNDCDGLTDANDPDCEAPPEVCDNGVDDNGNGLVDCADPQCDGFVGAETTCGVGACAATGNLVCTNGAQADDCTPGQPGQEGPFGDVSCTDGIDNDCDGLTDTNDPDCEAQPEVCDNGVDDNGNGLVDCEDPQCDGFVDGTCDTGEPGICAAGTFVCQNQTQACVQDQQPGAEGPSGDPTCEDGLDNDCNGLTDANDPACEPTAEICDNGVDDNGNNLVDCADPACEGFVDGACDTGEPGICAAGTFICQNAQQFCQQDEPAGVEGPAGSPTCTDGLDNDCDGLTDANDPECAAPAEICDNGVDDNGNGLVDCADPQCEGVTDGACDTGVPGICAAGTLVCQGGAQVCVQDQQPGTEGPAGDVTCSDGLDNDCDGLMDAMDPDCQTVAEICDNGIDDDANGLIDCADPACEGFVDGACDTGQSGICAAGSLVCQDGGQVCVQDQQPGVEGPFGSPTCSDGLDNDCDGLTDAEDADCAPPASVEAEVDAPKRINGASRGNTPIEIEFETLGMVKLGTLACGAKNRLVQCLPDGTDCRVNREDPNEFVALVQTPAMELRCSDREILCEGTLADGTPFAGADEIDVLRDYEGRRCDGKGKDDKSQDEHDD